MRTTSLGDLPVHPHPQPIELDSYPNTSYLRNSHFSIKLKGLVNLLPKLNFTVLQINNMLIVTKLRNWREREEVKVSLTSKDMIQNSELASTSSS